MLRKQLSFQNTFPILAQQSLQHGRANSFVVVRDAETLESTLGEHEKGPLLSVCYSEGFFSAIDYDIISENCIRTSLVQMSRFWKMQFPQITMVNRSLGLASPDK